MAREYPGGVTCENMLTANAAASEIAFNKRIDTECSLHVSGGSLVPVTARAIEKQEEKDDTLPRELI